MKIVISQVIANLDEKIYFLFELFDLKRWSDEFVFGCILTLEVKNGTFQGF